MRQYLLRDWYIANFHCLARRLWSEGLWPHDHQGFGVCFDSRYARVNCANAWIKVFSVLSERCMTLYLYLLRCIDLCIFISVSIININIYIYICIYLHLYLYEYYVIGCAARAASCIAALPSVWIACTDVECCEVQLAWP
jgi:hypothetical protein